MLRAAALATFLALGSAVALADGDPGKRSLPGAHQSFSVGPYSQVETLAGGLTTTIPIVSLKGPGESSMSMSVFHRSNTKQGLYYDGALGSPGAGWCHDVGGYIYQGTSSDGSGQLVQSTGNPLGAGGLPLAYWKVTTTVNGSTVTYSYAKRPGTRQNVIPLYTSNQLSGYQVKTLDGRMTWNYTERVQTGQANVTLNSFRLKSVVDAHGNTVSYLYNTDGTINKVTDAATRTLTFGYTAGNPALLDNVTLTTTDGSKSWNFEHTDAAPGHDDWLTAIRPPKPDLGQSARPAITFGYDGTLSIVNVYDLRGYLWHYDYAVNTNFDLSGVRVVSAAYHPTVGAAPGYYDATLPTTFAYNRNGSTGERTCAITDWYVNPAGTNAQRTREHVYEDLSIGSSPGNEWFQHPIIRVVDPYYSGGPKWWETYGWDYTQGNLTNRSDKNARAWAYSYLTSGANDNSGLLGQVKDYNNVVREAYGYDSNFRLTAELKAVVNTAQDGLRYTCTRHSYDATYGDETSTVVDASSDGFGWTKPQPARTITTTRTFDAQGNLSTSIVSGDTAGSSFTDYDKGQPKTVTTPEGGTTTFTYDAEGRKKTQQNPISDVTGSLTTTTYDNWGRPTSVVTTTDAGSSTIATEYDFNSNVTKVTPPVGRATTTVYDVLNRPTSVTQPVDGTAANDVVTQTVYDLAGRVSQVINGRAKATIRKYDERDLMVSEQYPTETARTWTYNGNGQPLVYKNSAGFNTTSTYDSEDNLATIAFPDGRNASYVTRLDGNRTSATMSGVGTTTYAFNEAGELIRTVQPAPFAASYAAVEYTYGANSPRRATMLLKESASGTIRANWAYQYDAGNRIEQISQNGTLMASYEYYPNGAVKNRYEGTTLKTAFGYTKQGLVKSIVHSTTAGAQIGTKVGTSYLYDAMGNVSSCATTEPGKSTITATYGYDTASQLLSEARTNSPTGLPTSAVYTYDKAGNRLTIARNGGAASAAFSYSDNDRFNSGDGYSFSNYTADGSPKTVTIPVRGTATLTYNSAEQMTSFVGAGSNETYLYDAEGRRYERAVTSGATTRTRYVYDGDTPVAEIDGNAALLRLNIPGVGYTESSSTVFSRENGIGNQLATADPSGNALSRTEYDAFGNEAVITAGARGARRFVGKAGYLSDDTGLDLLGSRYYVPGLGRFLTQDPIGQKGGLNIYAYCGNNPLVRTDPNGQDWDWSLARYQTGQVLLGELDVVNPINIVKNTFNAGRLYGQYTFDDPMFGGVQFAGAVGGGLWNTLTGWDLDHPREFGRAAMTALTIAAGPVSKFATPSLATESLVFRARVGKGNFGMGAATWDEAMAAGARYLGKGFRAGSDGKGWVSADGLRYFRGPTYKPKLGYSQANFQARPIARGPMTSNGHLNVRP